MANTAIQNVTSAVPTNPEILSLIYSGTVFKRNAVMTGGASTSAATRRTLTTPSWIICGLGGVIYTKTSTVSMDLDTASNWDDSDLATAANRAGKDFYLWACPPTSPISITLSYMLSDSSSSLAAAPSGYSTTGARVIGGFHCLCVDVGTIGSHTLTGYLDGDILPLSVWDLLHRALSSNIDMVWSEKAGVWVDIYLASGTGTSTTSVYGGTISNNRNWMDFVDDFGAVDKQLLDDSQFQLIADGSNEETNITGSAAPGTTGGHVDTASRRMVSNIGCEDCCGALHQWLRDQAAMYDGAVSAGWYDHSTKGSFYRPEDSNDVKLLAGGGWNDAANCGSRSRIAHYSRWPASTAIGARGCSSPRIVTID